MHGVDGTYATLQTGHAEDDSLNQNPKLRESMRDNFLSPETSPGECSIWTACNDTTYEVIEAPTRTSKTSVTSQQQGGPSVMISLNRDIAHCEEHDIMTYELLELPVRTKTKQLSSHHETTGADSSPRASFDGCSSLVIDDDYGDYCLPDDIQRGETSGDLETCEMIDNVLYQPIEFNPSACSSKYQVRNSHRAHHAIIPSPVTSPDTGQSCQIRDTYETLEPPTKIHPGVQMVGNQLYVESSHKSVSRYSVVPNDDERVPVPPANTSALNCRELPSHWHPMERRGACCDDDDTVYEIIGLPDRTLTNTNLGGSCAVLLSNPPSVGTPVDKFMIQPANDDGDYCCLGDVHKIDPGEHYEECVMVDNVLYQPLQTYGV